MHRKLSYRRDPRLEETFPAEVNLGQGPQRAVCQNVSRGGALIEGIDLPIGAELELTLPLSPELTIITRAKVVHRTDDEAGVSGLGLQFVGLSPDEHQRIRAFVESARPVEQPVAVASWAAFEVVTV